MDCEAIQQAALALDCEERAELGFLLLDTVKGLSDEEVESGEEPPTVQREEILKIAGEALPQTDSILVRAALSLSVKERDELMNKLRDSIDYDPPGEKITGREWEKAWRIEIERRVRESDEGKVKSLPWEEVRKELWGPLP